MNRPENPNKNLELVIKNSDLPSLSKEYLEIAIDGIMDEGILKEIPLVGSVIGAIKFGNSISQHLATKKIYKFLLEIQNVPQEQRIKKINEINNSEKYQSTVGEMIIEFLEKIESDLKPEIVGRLFCAFLDEKIDYQTYLKAVHIMSRLFIYDLLELKENYDGKFVYKYSTELVLNGLVDVDFTISYEEAKADYEGREYNEPSIATLTQIGEIIIKIGMQ